MSQDYSNSKPGLGAIYLDHAIDSVLFARTEPLMTPELLKQRFLFGIPLESPFLDPVTRKRPVLTDAALKDYIIRAVNVVEFETGMVIFPTQFAEKYPYDKAEYESFGYFRLEHRPICSIESLTITFADNHDLFEIPPDWIETAYLIRGQVNIIPLSLSVSGGGGIPNGSPGMGAVFLSMMQRTAWVPAYWKLVYTAGFPNGQIPYVVNELIGIVAAMDILSQLAAVNARTTSTSLGIDGLSQAVGTPGPNLYTVRLQDLKLRRDDLVARLKAFCGLGIFSNNV